MQRFHASKPSLPQEEDMNTLHKRCLMLAAVALVLGLFAETGLARQQLTMADKLTPDPAITIGKLDNGLIYYVRENKKPEKRCELRLAVKVGSVVEDDDQLGLAHFVEHMAFNGTENFPKMEIINFLEKSGMKFGPEVNAMTSFDQTVYMLQLPTDSIQVLKKGFQILQQWAQHVAFDGTEIDKERGVIIEEWRLGQGAQMRILMQQLPYLLYNSQYAKRFVIGKKEVLESFKHETLKRYYRDWYRPDMMAVVAVGDFNGKEIVSWIKEHFSGLKNPVPERPRVEYPVPTHKETLVTIASDAELPMSMCQIIFKRPVKDTYTAGDYRDELVDRLCGSMLSARYAERVQKPNPPFVFAAGVDQRFLGNVQVTALIAALKETSILDGIDALVTEAYRAKQHGFTATELERQKKQVVSQYENMFKEREKRQSRMLADEYVRNFLQKETIPGIEVEYEMARQFMPGVGLEEVNKRIAERLQDEGRVITLSLPKKESIKVPTEAEILATFNAASTKRHEPYVDKVSTQPLLAKLPQPGKIVSEKKTESIGVTEWVLSNGARVILKPTDFKDDEVLFSAYSKGGHSLVDENVYRSATNAATLVSQSGVGEFDAIVLQKMLTGKMVNVYPMISELSEGFSGSAAPKDLETLFQLVYLYGTAPRKDTSAISALMTRMRASLQNRSADPNGVFMDTVQVTMANYHYRGKPLTTALLSEINPDKALAFYKDRFADFSDFTFFFVGNIKPESIKPFVEQYLASLPSIKRTESWRDVGVKAPPGPVSKTVYKGMEPKSTVQMYLTGPFEWTDQNRYDFMSLIELMRIKLREVVREEKGGTYGISVYGAPSLYPRKEYSLTISWGCSPDRVDELVGTVLQQLDSLKMKRPDQVYVDKVQEQQRRTYEVNLKENNFWMSNFRTFIANGESLEDILKYPSYVEKLSGQAIQNAAKTYLQLNTLKKFVLYPEKKN
jgi:zinc protease